MLRKIGFGQCKCKGIQLIFCVILVPVFNLSAQPDTLWTKIYGGDETDVGLSVQQTSDKGYILTGYSLSFGNGSSDIWVIKTDSLGDTLWTKIYGGASTDHGISAQQTADGGYILVGWTFSYGNGDSDVWLLKLNFLGDTVWTRTYGGNAVEEGRMVQQTSDNGYIITGFTKSFGAGETDLWLIKTDSVGIPIWTKTYGGAMGDEGWSVQQTADLGYIITGWTESYGTERNLWIIYVDSLGTPIWTKVYEGSGYAEGHLVRQTSDSGYIVTGCTGSDAGDLDLYLLKTDGSGNILWDRVIGGSNHDGGESVQQTMDGGYIVTGYTNSFGQGAGDLWVLRFDSLGDTLWTKTYGGPYPECGLSIQETSYENYIVAGYTISFGMGSNDVWLLKIGSESQIIEDQNANYKLMPKVFCYPNPFTTLSTIEFQLIQPAKVDIELYNSLGQKVKIFTGEYKRQGTYKVRWDGKGMQGERLADGVYFCRLRAGKSILLTKIEKAGFIQDP